MYAKYHIAATKLVLSHNFSPVALNQIIQANLSQDSIAHLFLSSESYRHFCNDKISASLAYIEEQHALIERLARLSKEQMHEAKELAQRQRMALGRLLHTVQDFYSHTNYVDLWLREHCADQSPVAAVIDGLDQALLNHYELRTAHWFVLEILFHIPIIGVLLRRVWLPPHSHEAMHLDSPERGLRFIYSMIMAQQRTAKEYQRAVKAIISQGGPEALQVFHQGD